DVDADEAARPDGLDRQIAAAVEDLPARGPLGGEEAQLFQRERALLEHPQERRADSAGRSENRQPRHQTSTTGGVSSSNASCSARTAAGTSSRAIMQLILMGDVEIMRRLMSRSASVRNMRAGPRGCERMPAPISEPLPIPSFSSTCSGPSECSASA